METAEEKKYKTMTEEPVNRLVWKLAVPTMIAMMVTAAYNMADTFFVGRIGTEATAGVGLILPVMTIIQAIGFFFGQGFQPICGFNFGAKRYDRVWNSYKYCVKISFLFLLAMSALGFALAPSLVAVFRDDADVIAFGTIALRMQSITFSLMSVVTLTNMKYQNMGRVWGATLLAAARQGLMFVPAVLILPKLFSTPVWGVYLAQPAADVFAFAIAVPMAIRVYKEFKKSDFGNKPGGEK